MKIKINGEEHGVDEPLLIADLLAQIGMNRQPVVVELNGVALHRNELETTMVEEGARVEIVRIAAGG